MMVVDFRKAHTIWWKEKKKKYGFDPASYSWTQTVSIAYNQQSFIMIVAMHDALFTNQVK